MMARHAILPVYLALCLLLGGASAAGIAANLVLQLVAIPLICWAVWSLMFQPPSGAVRSLLVLCGLLVMLVLAHLVPLPPSIWTLLPGRDQVVENHALLELGRPWAPLSLAPDQTRAALFWLLPAFAVLLAAVALGAFRSRWVAWAILIVTALAVGLGALQVVGGRDSGAYLYRFTNYGNAVGFFANGNHAATLLLVAIPFIAALQAHGGKRSRGNASATTVLTVAAYAVVAIGLVTNTSLAGIGLGIPVALATFFWIGARRRRPAWWMFVIGGLLSAATVAVIVAGPFQNNLFGEQVTNSDLSRQTSFRLTMRAAAEYLPVGSGIGSFQGVYHTQEPAERVTRTYMNHAHSDWLEILLETGLPGVALAVAFLIWWGARVRTIWNTDPADWFGRAAAIASGTILLHSVVDYPLRTAALSAVFAMCLALMAGARPFVRRPTRTASAARHITA